MESVRGGKPADRCSGGTCPGYMGQILHVDLTKGTCEWKATDARLLALIGGSGFAADILYRETGPETAPLGPENVLCFMTGPLTGTPVMCSGRHEVAAKSPLTGIYGEASAGGYWGAMLKRAGVDGIVIRGRSESPVYLWIAEGRAELRSAAHLWGLDTFETDRRVKAETTGKAVVTCIGVAGERMVPLAAIMSEGKEARAAARGGLGAVMGSKNLKAVAVFGAREVPVHNRDALVEMNRRIGPETVRANEGMKRYGTGASLEWVEKIGDLPIKNWAQGTWKEPASRIGGMQIVRQMRTRMTACHRCPIGCGKMITEPDGPYGPVDGRGPEYESLAALGSYVLMDDLDAIVYANELCNRLGLDTISTGATIAFAMELYEKGIIGAHDTGGLHLKWGDPQTVFTLIGQIARKEGFGAVLGLGTRQASMVLGRGAEEYAMQVKGLELPAHDPRARSSLALAYATSNRGACHLQGQSSIFESRATDPSIGIDKPLDPHTWDGKADLVAKAQAIGSMYDSLCLCRYFRPGVDQVSKYFTHVTGVDMTPPEFLRTGTRIFTLKRLYNLRCGITRKDDTIPPRIATLAFPEGGSAGHLPHLGKMLGEYYRIQGWSEDGIPTLETIRELGLEEYAALIPGYLVRHKSIETGGI